MGLTMHKNKHPGLIVFCGIALSDIRHKVLPTLTVDNVPLLQWSEVGNTMTDHLIDGPAGSETRTAKAEVRNTLTDHLNDGPARSDRDKNRKSSVDSHSKLENTALIFLSNSLVIN